MTPNDHATPLNATLSATSALAVLLTYLLIDVLLARSAFGPVVFFSGTVLSLLFVISVLGLLKNKIYEFQKELLRLLAYLLWFHFCYQLSSLLAIFSSLEYANLLALGALMIWSWKNSESKVLKTSLVIHSILQVYLSLLFLNGVLAFFLSLLLACSFRQISKTAIEKIVAYLVLTASFSSVGYLILNRMTDYFIVTLFLSITGGLVLAQLWTRLSRGLHWIPHFLFTLNVVGLSFFPLETQLPRFTILLLGFCQLAAATLQKKSALAAIGWLTSLAGCLALLNEITVVSLLSVAMTFLILGLAILFLSPTFKKRKIQNAA